MRIFYLNITSALLLLTVICNGQSNGDVLFSKITLNSDSLTRTQLFDQISTQTGAFFSYDPDLINANQIVSAHYFDQQIGQILPLLIENNEIAFRAIDKQIVLFLKIAENEEAEKPKVKIIQGVLIDSDQYEPLPYCNIAIVGKAVGTISNHDGRFELKINELDQLDTLMFSSIGYATHFIPIHAFTDSDTTIYMNHTTFEIKEVEVIYRDPIRLIDEMVRKIPENYELENALFTNFYRETIKEENKFTEVSEAVLQIIKVPYDDENSNDIVRFVKGRKTKTISAVDSIRFRLKGGPHYITKLDVVKNNETFINPTYQSVYNYYFDKKIYFNDRETWLIDFKPIRSLSEILYTGTLYIDVATSALSRVEFQLTRQGLKEAGRVMIVKQPKHFKATPTDLKYSVQYKLVGRKWYFQTAQSSISVRLSDKENNIKTNFLCISEILTTNIEKGEIPYFVWREIFKPFDFVTDKIIGYDNDFWGNYNVILPEEELSKVFKNAENDDINDSDNATRSN